MANIVTFELQTIDGGLHLAKRALDDVRAKVTSDPGPVQDPVQLQLIADIIATASAITREATEVQTILQGLPPAPGTAP